MAATLHILHPTPPPIGSFLRVGHTGHRKIEALIAASRLRFRRFVFDAAHIDEQQDLRAALKRAGCEIVLDPNAAEAATLGRFESSVSALPWNNPDRPWVPEDFNRLRNLDTAKSIAEFALRHDVDAVLAPTHCIESFPDPWITVDSRLSMELRQELDRNGGSHIPIDYQIITSNTLLKDTCAREALIASIRDLPIENIWLRASGFGAHATGAATRSLIEAARDFHSVGRPIVADYAGGLSALATAAFGGTGALCHGLGQKEGFRLSDWKKTSSGGGSAKRIYIPELDRSLNEEQLNILFSVRGTRSRFGCNDTSCCAHGIEDMIENPHRHFAIQRSKQISNLSDVPESRRAEHYLLNHLDPVIRSARIVSRVRFGNEDITKLLAETKKRLVNLRDPLGDLLSTSALSTRSASPKFRGHDQAHRLAMA